MDNVHLFDDPLDAHHFLYLVTDRVAVLEQEGVARVQGPAGDEALRDLVLKSLTEPIEDGVLELFPRVVGLRRSESGMTVELEIPEMMG